VNNATAWICLLVAEAGSTATKPASAQQIINVGHPSRTVGTALAKTLSALIMVRASATGFD